GKLFPSQFVNIRLLVDTLQNQTVVPVAAVQRGAGSTFVFIVNPDKTVNQRSVKLGVQDGDQVAILEGLRPGDTVVVDGADRLRDGAQVNIPAGGRIVEPSPAPAGAGGNRGGGNPAQRAARLAAITKACSADIAKLCAGQDARTATRCLFQNASSLSSDCSKAVTSGRRGGGGGGFGGGFGGGPGGGGGFGGGP